MLGCLGSFCLSILDLTRALSSPFPHCITLTELAALEKETAHMHTHTTHAETHTTHIPYTKNTYNSHAHVCLLMYTHACTYIHIAHVHIHIIHTYTHLHTIHMSTHILFLDLSQCSESPSVGRRPMRQYWVALGPPSFCTPLHPLSPPPGAPPYHPDPDSSRLWFQPLDPLGLPSLCPILGWPEAAL